MSDISLITKVYIVLVCILSCLFLVGLYRAYSRGKPIVKVNRKNRPIFWIWTTLFVVWTTLFSIEFIRVKGSVELDGLIKYIFWIEVCVINMMGAYHGSQIRENGVFGDGYLYKWSNVSSYKWISDEVIQFRVKNRFQDGKIFEFIVKEELKLKVEDVLKNIGVK